MKKELYIYNTLTKQKELFEPLNDDFVRMYSCGPTVYSKPHIGNMRAYSFVDTLVRALEISGYKVQNLINITDVGHLTSDEDHGDDKLELAAKKNNQSAYDIAEMYTILFYQYLKDLNIKSPTKFPKATEHIEEQIHMIRTLEEKGFTYITNDGVYFDTSKFETYSELANIKIEGLREGARVQFGDKKNITDFALWKFSPKNEKREMEWDSPWGLGFPGWHIECSAMAMKYLGNQIDIHTGGIDHIHIHHSNEIAQSEAYSDKKFVNYWMHVNFLQLENDNNDNDNAEIKMSKSKGTAYTIDQIQEMGYDALAIKYFYLTAHYRNELKFNFDILDSASKTFNRLRNKILEIKKEDTSYDPSSIIINQKLVDYILDDLDTPKVLASFHEIINSDASNVEKLNSVATMDLLFGLNFMSYEIVNDIIPESVYSLAKKRELARENKEWLKSDKLRDEINKLGYSIKDENNGFILSINKIKE